MIFGRTDLRKGVSGAKFDAKYDFEVRLAVALPKSEQNCENKFFGQKQVAQLCFPTSDFFRFFRIFGKPTHERMDRRMNADQTDQWMTDFAKVFQSFSKMFQKIRDPEIRGDILSEPTLNIMSVLCHF